jgi:hypothetical protein
MATEADGAGASGAGAGASSAGAGAEPGKSATDAGSGGGRDWAKDYGELEGKYKSYESLGMGSDDLKKTVDWARTVYQQIQSGDLIPKTAAQQARESQTPQADPYDKWEDLNPREQADLLRREAREAAQAARKEIEGPFEQRFNDFTKNQGVQQKLFMQVVQQLVKDPSLDATEVLTKATELATLSPEKLLEFAINQASEPRNRKTAIEQAVQAELARRQQEDDKKRMGILTGRTGPRLVADKSKNPRERRDGAIAAMFKKADELSRSSG